MCQYTLSVHFTFIKVCSYRQEYSITGSDWQTANWPDNISPESLFLLDIQCISRKCTRRVLGRKNRKVAVYLFCLLFLSWQPEGNTRYDKRTSVLFLFPFTRSFSLVNSICSLYWFHAMLTVLNIHSLTSLLIFLYVVSHQIFWHAIFRYVKS